MTRFVQVLAVVLVFLGLGSWAMAASADAEPIKIGAIFAVTGPASFLGAPEAKTAQMLVDKMNAAGGIDGRKIELIIKDSGRQPQERHLLGQAVDRGEEGPRHHRPLDQRRDAWPSRTSARRQRPS